MASDTKQTRCPHCCIAFYITHAQILAAEGTVRCGICLSLFDANENTVVLDGNGKAIPLSEQLSEADDQSPEPECADKQRLEIYPEAELVSDSTGQTAALEEGPGDPDLPDAELVEVSEPGRGSEAGEAGQRPLYLRQLDDLSETLPEQVPGFPGSKLETIARPRSRRWSLLSLALLGFVALFMQLLFFTSAQLSTNEGYRPTVKTVCAWLGCPVAEQRNLSLIHSDALVIKNHQTIANAMQVDVVIINRAEFVQSFPGLQLEFKDLRGNVVAQRTFRPNEYLSGALTGLTSMKPQQSYQISLELVEPATSAVSYTLNIVN